MRIIAGQYHGRKIKSPPSLKVRPTSDRLRETLFNVVAPRIVGARVLDLCSGSGAIGIEALSRDAAQVTFVDRSRKMCGLIEANLDLVRAPEEQTTVVHADAADFLRHSMRDSTVHPWDLIFFDPPYDSDYSRVLELIGSNVSLLLSDGALVVAEHHHKTELPNQTGQISRKRILKQGDSALSFYEKI